MHKRLVNLTKWVLLIVFTMGVTTAFSQKIMVGFNGGGNYSLLTLNETTKRDGLPLGYTVGASGQFHLKNHFSLSPEINFDYRVYRTKGNLGIADEPHSDVRYSLLQITTPLKYTLGEEGSFYFYGGPYIAYSLNSLAYVTLGDDYFEDDLNDYFARFQFGYLVGVGYTRPLTTDINLFLDVNYSESLLFFGEGLKGNNDPSSKAIRLRTGLMFTIR